MNDLTPGKLRAAIIQELQWLDTPALKQALAIVKDLKEECAAADAAAEKGSLALPGGSPRE